MSKAMGANLRKLRRARGFSAKEVALAIGVAESTYRDWEYGRAIRGEPYVKLADVFQVSIAELMLAPGASDREELVKKLDQIIEAVNDIKVRL